MGNIFQSIQAGIVMVLVGLAIWLYFDYTGTKRANVLLTQRVEQAEANYSLAKSRIDEFSIAQEKFDSDLEALRLSSIAIRSQVREALSGLRATEIESEYRDNPVEAEAALRSRLSGVFGMFDRATGASSDPR